eukprot:gb/GECH01007392.1/.p1 GENE.gb/GECH01007392.1/~~gb/GECH01007392.1/.p1  ORF type:complete len:366 (+),score=70.20 gb/GECH01007392.1/:1-1098(+)
MAAVDITVLEASNLPSPNTNKNSNNNNNSTTLHNVYVSFRVHFNTELQQQLGPTKRTAIISKTNNPKWNTSFRLLVPDFCNTIYCKSKHYVKANRLLGSCIIPLCSLHSAINTETLFDFDIEADQNDSRQIAFVQGKLKLKIKVNLEALTYSRSDYFQIIDLNSNVICLKWGISNHIVNFENFASNFTRKSFGKTFMSELKQNIKQNEQLTLQLAREFSSNTNSLSYSSTFKKWLSAVNVSAFCQKHGLWLEEFQLHEIHVCSPDLSLAHVRSLQKWWLLKALPSQENRKDCKTKTCNALVFYLDSLKPSPTWYCKTPSNGVLSSSQICSSESRSMTIDVALTSEGGWKQRLNFSQLLNFEKKNN